jgi:MFS-type transporter involved in bile tolerance (Atg22 family)
VAPRLHDRFGPTTLLRAGLLIEITTHVVLVATRSPWFAGAVIVLFGVHTVVWGVVVATLRQRIVPDGLRGRVNGVYSLLDLGGAALGTLLDAFIAQA